MFDVINDLDFSGYTLLVTCVSVGNISVMSADLLIRSLKMKKSATCWHPACTPITGVNPFGHNYQAERYSPKNYLTLLNTALEIFHDPIKKIAVLQMRSPITKVLKTEFISDLVFFIRRQSFSKIFILSSCYSYKLAYLCDGVYNRTTAMRYTGNQKVIRLTKAFQESPNWQPYNANDDDSSLINSIPGCAKALYEKCLEKKLPVVLIFKYCTDGDNKDEALVTLQIVNELINVLNVKSDGPEILIPKSWKCLYGNVHPDNIY
uniref:Proteasome assembly chaperone 2 n=1 Tax=Xenopsylla cheopis TaxID=163159 RepID=A0A6M2DFX7_XENCH